MSVRKNKSTLEQQIIVVTFQLGTQTYALPLAPVRQIIEMVKITPLPQVSQIIVGVINFHGELVPVISMRRLFELEEIPLELHTPIILVNISEHLVGLIVDKVLDVLEEPADQVVDPNNILLKELGETPLLQGLIHTKDGSILILNPEHLFTTYHTRALSKAIDTLAQMNEQSTSDGEEVTRDQKIRQLNQDNGAVAQTEPEDQPVYKSKGGRRKKTAATSKVTKEGSK